MRAFRDVPPSSFYSPLPLMAQRSRAAMRLRRRVLDQFVADLVEKAPALMTALVYLRDGTFHRCRTRRSYITNSRHFSRAANRIFQGAVGVPAGLRSRRVKLVGKTLGSIAPVAKCGLASGSLPARCWRSSSSWQASIALNASRFSCSRIRRFSARVAASAFLARLKLAHAIPRLTKPRPTPSHDATSVAVEKRITGRF